jgi:hypothetical protein
MNKSDLDKMFNLQVG